MRRSGTTTSRPSRRTTAWISTVAERSGCILIVMDPDALVPGAREDGAAHDQGVAQRLSLPPYRPSHSSVHAGDDDVLPQFMRDGSAASDVDEIIAMAIHHHSGPCGRDISFISSKDDAIALVRGPCPLNLGQWHCLSRNLQSTWHGCLE